MRQRGLEQEYRSRVEQEEWHGERKEYHSEKIGADWIKKSRLEQTEQNEEIRVNRSKLILKEINQSYTGKRFLIKGKWCAANQTASHVFLGAQSRNLGWTNRDEYDDDDVGDIRKSNTEVDSVERRPEEMWNDGGNGRRDGRRDED